MRLNTDNGELSFRVDIGAKEKQELADLATSLKTDITTMVTAWITHTLAASDGREQFLAALQRPSPLNKQAIVDVVARAILSTREEEEAKNG